MITGVIAGAFDVIHPGYIKLFNECKKHCDKLHLFLHIDPSIERPDTKIKPVHTLDEREEILLSIRYVDQVIRYKTEQDLLWILENTKIDVRILGSDYKDKDYTGKDFDIEVHFHNRDHNYSTTKLKQKIKEM